MISKSIEQIQALKNDIVSEFEIDNISSISYYLEIKMMRDCKVRTITLSQKDYIKKVLELLNMNEDHSTAMSDVSEKYYENNFRTASVKDFHNYLHIIDSIMYEMIQTQLNFVFQISHLASFLKNSSNEHFSNMKHLIHYLHEMVNHCIIYSKLKDDDKSADLVDYSDLNFSVCRMTR